ncbi:MAG: DNA polymerase III subunit epsilon [Alphaproteobacteria bacterium]|nr:DNA polymerase III subunit epsilon [Alphaproteobacteria bacterium]
MAREIVLDTETTGLDPRTGHRVIELACVEVEDLTPTGRTFHRYINPERDIDPDAERVHGISRAFLNDKPVFSDPDVVDAFLDFIGEAQLVAHNAGFDRNFLNAELALAGRASLAEPRWVDTLALAQRQFPGMFNSLDALCKRFKISLAERDKHGALIDTQLLARVYLELRGGREPRLDLNRVESGQVSAVERPVYGPRPRVLAPRLSASEAARHAEFLLTQLKSGHLWGEVG